VTVILWLYNGEDAYFMDYSVSFQFGSICCLLRFAFEMEKELMVLLVVFLLCVAGWSVTLGVLLHWWRRCSSELELCELDLRGSGE